MTFLVTYYKSSEEPLSEGATPYYFLDLCKKVLDSQASRTPSLLNWIFLAAFWLLKHLPFSG